MNELRSVEADAVVAGDDPFDRLCREQIAPRAREADRGGRVPAASRRDLARAGYLQLFHPTYWGGSAADGRTQGRAMESLARACAATFWEASISTVLCGKMLATLCRPRHHWQWLQPILRGEAIGCFAASEEGAGSDPSSYRTTLRRTPRGLRLSGIKQRISNASTADVAVVLARDEANPGGGLCYVVLDLRRAGIGRREIPKLGLAAMSWGTLAFEDVAIEAEDVIADAHIEQALVAVEWGQVLQTFCAIGIAQACLEASRAYVLERQAFGRPIAHLQVVHSRIADMHAEIDTARLLAVDVARIKAEGRAARELVLMAKIHSTEMAVRVADMAMRTFGGWGYSKDHDVERLYRDSLANVPAGLPTDRLRELLACGLIGADPWSYEPFDGLREWS